MNNNLLINNFARLTQSPENVAELKKLVLQLAVQGKLTKNWRNSPFEGGKGDVETGTQLLEKIKAEKQELIKQGKLKHQKPLPKIEENEIPFDIPDSWVWTRLGGFCNKITDGFHNTPPKAIHGVPYIAATHVKSKGIDWNNCNYVEEKHHKELFFKANPQKGELLIVNIGAGCGTTAIIDVNFEFSFKNGAILKFNQENLLNTYIKIYSDKTKEKTYEKLTRGGAQPFLSLKTLNNIIIPLPPLSEQKAIVSTIESLFEKIDQLHEKSKQKQALQQKTAETLLQRINAQNANLQEDWQLLQTNFGTLINQKQAVKQLRQTILQLAVQGKLTKNWRNSPFEGGKGDVETGTQLLEKIKAEKQELIKQGKLKHQKPLPKIEENEIPFDIPDSWVWTRLGEIVSLHNGDRSSSYPKKSETTDYGIPFLNSTNIINGKICLQKQQLRFITVSKFNSLRSGHLKNDDILFVLRGSVGKNGIFVSNSEFNTGFINAQIVILRKILNLNARYIGKFLNSDSSQNLLSKKITGSAIPQIGADKVNYFLFPLPPLSEQQAIVSIVEKLLKMCDNLEQKIEESENLNKKLMQTIVKEYT